MKRKTIMALAAALVISLSSVTVMADELNVQPAQTETTDAADTDEATDEADTDGAVDIEDATNAADTDGAADIAEAADITDTVVTADAAEASVSTLAATCVASGTEGTLKWALNSDGLLVVSGSGDYMTYEYEENGASNYYPAWYKYRTQIKNAVITASGLTTTQDMFYGCTNLTAVKFSGLGTATLVYMDNMFQGCSSLTNVIFTAFNTSKVEGMGGVFYGCSSLKNINLAALNTESVIWMTSMFEGCSSLTSLDFSSWETPNLGNVNSMFDGCSSLTDLDLTALDLSNLYNSDFMFSDCTALKTIELPDDAFKTIPCMQYMFENCENLSLVLNLQSRIWECTDAFKGAATAEGALIIINYSGDCTEEDALAAAKTRSTDSKVYIYPQTPILRTCQCTVDGVKITWAGYRPEGYSFRIYRKTGKGGWTKLADTTAGNYLDTSVVSDTDYSYTVRLINNKKSAVSGYNQTGLSVKYIAAPANVKVSKISSGMRVTWTKSTGAEKYRVYRRTEDTGWTKLGDTVNNYFTDTKIESGIRYYYTVRCLSSDGKKFTSAINLTGVSAAVMSQPVLTLSNAADGVSVKWNAVNGAEKYGIYRKEEGTSGWKGIATVSAESELTYIDKKATAGKVYFYTVKAICGSCSSTFDTSKKICALELPVVTVENTEEGIQVNWTETTSATKYIVFRRTADGSWSPLATITDLSSLTYLDQTAEMEASYYYTVRAYSGSYKSAFASSDMITRVNPEENKEESGEGTGEETGEGTGETTGEGTGETTGETIGEGTGETTGEGTGETTGEGTGETTGETTGEGTGETTGEGTGETTGEGTGETSGETIGETTVETI